LIRDGYRFSEKDMRQRKNLAGTATRRYEGRMTSLAKLPSCLLILASLAPLAGCAGGNSSANLAPAAPQPAAAPAPAPSTQITGPVVQTPEKIKADCWMKYEEDKKIKNLDQRLALVEKCVDEATRNQPPQRN